MGDIKMVSQEIGHSSVVMTEYYAKLNFKKYHFKILKNYQWCLKFHYEI